MKYVLITGATAGIGKEIAYSYASRGYNLFLIARREKRLIDISKQISDEFNINVRHLVSNIFASALCPGFTITEFHQQSGTQDRMDKVPAFMKMSAKDVAEAGVNGILNKKSVVIPGVIYKLIVILFKFTPLWLVRFLGNKLAGGRFKT